MSRTFRFHVPTAIAPSNATKLLRKRKPRNLCAPQFLAADKASITDMNGTWPIDAYRNLDAERYITLTRKEADIIALANPGTRPPMVIEDIYPWLPRQTFRNDSKANYRSLNHILRRYARHLVTAADFCDEKWNTICNAIRLKNDMDARFFTAWHTPIQAAFILEENGPERSVIALDFNAMYPACMQYPFPKSAAMRHIMYNRDLGPAEDLPIGLYRCVLSNPSSDFIRRHNPFRSFFAGRQLQAALSEPLEIDLNEFEIYFFRRHFGHIHIVDGVISDKTIAHPLAREAKRSFARRQNYRAQGNKPLADREKFFATLMSSCSQRPNKSRHMFDNETSANDYLRSNYGICSYESEPDCSSEIWLSGRKGIIVSNASSGIVVEGPDIRDGSACFALNQRIVAQARIVLLEMMEKITTIAPNVMLCYVNIDSIHFSVPTIHIASVLEHLQSEASEEMGSFKIESVTRHGLWLEPGRYWLYSEIIEKFRNRSIGDRQTPFRDHVIHISNRKIDELHIPLKTTIRMDRSMSETITIIEDTHSGHARQSLVDLGEKTMFSDVLNQLRENRMHCIPKRMQVFRDLQIKIENTSSRCFGTR